MRGQPVQDRRGGGDDHLARIDGLAECQQPWPRHQPAIGQTAQEALVQEARHLAVGRGPRQAEFGRDGGNPPPLAIGQDRLEHGEAARQRGDRVLILSHQVRL